MLTILDPLREMDLLSVSLRMVLAVLCGGLIGMEREFKHRPAGFRTHILICLGAAMTTLTGQYLSLVRHYETDISRLGAQVIAGIGFIGAGTIMVTRRHRVRGLTTAAGLWAAAIVGLSLGAGFYEGGLLTTALILLAELVFVRLESRMRRSDSEVGIYVEYTGQTGLEGVLERIQTMGAFIQDLEVSKDECQQGRTTVLLSLRLSRGVELAALLTALRQVSGVSRVEEL